jgi:Lrp/AsnC family transcriptional regulator, leucine-responsive regulatory protein
MQPYTRKSRPTRKIGALSVGIRYVSCVDVAAPDVDATDLEIIELLRGDARRTLADIAGRVSLSSAAVKRRIDRLERDGVITGYTVLVDHAKLGQPLQAFTELRFAGNSPVDQIAAIADGIPEVQTVFTTAGDPDALAWIRVRDVEDLKRVIDLLRRSGRVTGTKTLMVLGTSTRA